MSYQNKNNNDVELFPKETTTLLSTTMSMTSDESSHSGDTHRMDGSETIVEQRKSTGWRWSNDALTAAVLLLTFVMGLNLANDLYNDYFRDQETTELDRREALLVDLYQEMADESIDLLNDLSKGQNIPRGCESTVLITRHCDDLGGDDVYPDGTSHCSYQGFERSLYLATLFGNDTKTDASSKPRWPLPTRLYGMWADHKKNKRQYEELRPLSDKSGVVIEMFDFDHPAEDVRANLFPLLASGEHCGEVVVIVFKHKFIRELAATLGCDRERGCPAGDIYAWPQYEFDSVWELNYIYQPEALLAYPHEESVLRHQNRVLTQGWKVLGTETREYFDPLDFKRAFYNGDEEGNWMHHDHDGHD